MDSWIDEAEDPNDRATVIRENQILLDLGNGMIVGLFSSEAVFKIN